ncbi:probable RNA-binding protein EIF1AD [Macadamia integrifolia]|uniref:probable RNA-binding protein EIF1AD n=1 Tax=Macadamia integrifolia TaxID=60698 RepID=UPI001C4EC978|nr:probable RNA-binding protein EIF1AD [Macadamia integrifolia]
MKGGRKNLKRASTEEIPTLLKGQSIMQVVSLRGSNLIEVMDAAGQKSLALFPAKFQKSMWIRRGSFVVVDESAKQKALESGSKVACMVVQVLFYEQICALQKSTEWPEIFRAAGTDADASNGYMQTPTSNPGEELNSSDSEGLAPLEGNLNRTRPIELYSDSESNSDEES